MELYSSTGTEKNRKNLRTISQAQILQLAMKLMTMGISMALMEMSLFYIKPVIQRSLDSFQTYAWIYLTIWRLSTSREKKPISEREFLENGLMMLCLLFNLNRKQFWMRYMGEVLIQNPGSPNVSIRSLWFFAEVRWFTINLTNIIHV